MKVIMTCPFCGEEHCIVETECGYHCTSCEYDFTNEEYEHEILRQQISWVCSSKEATEELPIVCTSNDLVVSIGGKPKIVKGVFQDFEGIVWVNVDGYNEPTEADELTNSELRSIFDWLKAM